MLLPDLFYRYHHYCSLVTAEIFAGDLMAIPGPLLADVRVQFQNANECNFCRAATASGTGA